MPSQSVSARQRAWQKIAHKYPGSRKDPTKRAARQARAIANERARQQRKAIKGK